MTYFDMNRCIELLCLSDLSQKCQYDYFQVSIEVRTKVDRLTRVYVTDKSVNYPILSLRFYYTKST